MRKMKNKIALLLTLILTFTIIPTNVFANSDAKLSDPPVGLTKESVLVEDYVVYTTDIVPGGEYQQIIDGTDLIIKPYSPINAGDTFHLQLENAKWFFRGAVPSSDFSAANIATFSNLMANNNMPPIPANWSTISTENWGPPTLTTSPQLPANQATYNINEGVWGYNTLVQPDGSLATQGTYYRLDTTGDSSYPEIPYKLEVSSDDTRATITILEDVNGNTSYDHNFQIRIPLVCRTTSMDDTKVKILQGNTAAIEEYTLVFGLTPQAYTKTHIPQDLGNGFAISDTHQVFDSSPIPIDELDIRETRILGLTKPIGEDDGFYITAPVGFEFADPSVNTRIGVNRGLTWADNSYGYGTAGTDYTISWKNAGTPQEDKSVIQVIIKGLNPAYGIGGAIYIEGLSLNAKSDAPSGAIMLEITNMDNDTNQWDMVTEQHFSAGVYANNTNNKNIKMTASPSKGGKPVATSGGSITTSATSGSAINISANPNKDYKFEYWTSSPANVTINSPNSKDTSFIMPDQNVEITAHYKYVGNNGSGNASGNYDDSDSNDNTTIYATPKPEATPTPTPSSEPEPSPTKDLQLRKPIMNGDIDGNFRPNDNLTRGEVAQVIYNSLYQGEALSQSTFEDVPQEQWYNDAINYVYANGYMVGYPDGSFSPDSPITRAEVLVVFDNIYEYSPITDQTDMYTDISDHWASEQINSATSYIGLEGYPDGSFKPDDNIIRGDFAIMLSKATERVDYVAENEFYDVNKTDYYYEYIMAVTNECK